MLGKTGAGKSSLIQSITGLSSIEVGNGFSPCTKTSESYDFPAEQPLIKFIDTRGLGEAHYDPSDDIEIATQKANVGMRRRNGTSLKEQKHHGRFG